MTPEDYGDDEPRPRRANRKVMCVDLIEDQMRCRFVAMFLALAMYLVVGSELIRATYEYPFETASTVFFASKLPTSGFLGPELMGGRATTVTVVSSLGTAFVQRTCPGIAGNVCEINSSYSEPVRVHASITRLSYEVDPPATTINCKTARLERLANTLEGAMIEDPCTPELTSNSNITDDTGLASFPKLAITSGPPATYTLAFSAGDGTEASGSIQLGSPVGSVLPLNSGGGVVLSIGELITPQPQVKVVSPEGLPLAGRTVVAFSSQVFNIYRGASITQNTFGGADFSTNGKVAYYARGQNFALLRGTRAVTDNDGVARFTNLTVTGASSRFVYLNFYCDGALASWSDPTMRPTAAGDLIKPRTAVLPSFVDSPINSVMQLASLPSSFNSSSDPPLDSTTAVVCPANPKVIVEGESFDETIRVRVGSVHAGSGAFTPLPNVTVFGAYPVMLACSAMHHLPSLLECLRPYYSFTLTLPVSTVPAAAVMHTSANFTLPLLFQPDVANLEHETSKTTSDVATTKFSGSRKRLLHALSTPSDEDGVATFPNLRFSTEGTSDDTMTDSARGPTHHKIAFCTPGATGSDYLSGCVVSCPYFVQSRAAAIDWGVAPNILRAQRSNRDAPSPGETVIPTTAGGKKVLLDAVPPTPVVRVLDTAGNGLGGKRVLPLVYVKSIAKSSCASKGISLSDAQLEEPLKYPCAANSAWWVRDNIVSLTLREGDGLRHETGDQGYLSLPLVYSFLDAAWVSGWGVADLTSGGVRIFVVSYTDRTIGTPLSPPITFARLGDTGQGYSKCARLVLADDISKSALGVGTMLYEQKRRPAVLAGFDVDGSIFGEALGAAANYAKNIELPSGQVQLVRDFDSFLMPPLMPVGAAGENVLSQKCTDTPACATSAASCPTGAAGVDCRVEHYVNTTLDTLGFPVIRLRAVNEDGMPVAGLRVRMRSLQQSLFPDLPRPTEIISCGLLTQSERDFFLSPAGAAYGGEGAIKSINARSEMDSVGSLEETLACETDANGYVDMKVRYVTQPGLLVLLANASNIAATPTTPEYVRSSVSGTVLVSYEGYLHDSSTGDYFAECSSDMMLLEAKSRAGTVKWTSGTLSTRTKGQISTRASIETTPDSSSKASFNMDVLGLDWLLQLPNQTADIPLAADLNTFETLSFRSDPVQVAAAEASIPKISFKVTDDLGQGVASIMASVRFVGVPYYLPGIWTYFKPECFTTSVFAATVRAQFPTFASWLTSCRTFYDDLKVEEHGLNAAFTANGAATPWFDHPWAPFATALLKKTDLSGNGWISPLIHLGHPGLYAIVVQADGVRSDPMYVPVKSKLASMSISTEPSMQAPAKTAIGLNVGEALSGGGGWHWPVGQDLAVPLEVKLSDSAGNALALYQPMIVPVDPDSGDLLDHLVSLDLPTIGLAQTDRGIGSAGLKRGAPASAAGVSVFPLKLIDGVNGTCFKLKVYFKAFSPADVALLVSEGIEVGTDGNTAYDDKEVSVTSTVKFCVKNEVTVMFESQLPPAVALGVTMGSANVRISIPMVPHTDGAGTTYYGFSRASLLMAPQLLPRVFGNRPVTGENLRQLGQRILSGNRCLVFGGFTVAGTCTDLGNDPTISPVLVQGANGGQVTGGYLANVSEIAQNFGAAGVALMPLFLPTIEGKAPTFTGRISLAGLTVKYRPPGGSSFQLGAGSALTMSSGSSARSNEVSISSTPADITFLTVPPEVVKVNEPFLMKVIVSISSGAPLAGASVIMKVVPTVGPRETPLTFLSQTVGPQTIEMSELSPPKLLSSSVEAITDESGVARFVLIFESGARVSQTSLIAEAGKVASPRTNPIVVTNVVEAVNATNITYSRTGAQGIGNKNTEAVRMMGEKPDKFPIVLELPDEMELSVQLGPAGIPADGNMSFLRRVIGFNVYSQADIDKLAEQRQKVEELKQKLANCTDLAVGTMDTTCLQDNLMDGLYLASQMSNGRRLQSVAGLANSIGAFAQSALDDNAEVQAALASATTAAAAFEQAQQLADSALLASLTPRDISALAPPTPDKLTQFAGLLVGGTLPSGSQAQGPVTKDAELLPVSMSMVEVNSVDSSNIVNISVRNLQLLVKKPGRYYLQPVIMGISGEIGGDILIEKYNPRTVEAVVIEYVFRTIMVGLIAFLGLANSSWHSPKRAVPITAIVLVALIVYTYLIYIHDNVQAWSLNSIGLWWMICFGGIMFGTGWGLLGLVKPLARIPLFRPFPVYRRQLYFSYCKRLVNEGHLTEVSKMQRRAADTNNEAVMIRERLYLQKRIEHLVHQERSHFTQLKALVKGIFRDDPEAFYVPVRFYAAFFISTFATLFVASWFIGAFSNLRTVVSKSDVNTLVAIFRSLSVLQAQFVAQTGIDLPSNAGGWLQANAMEIHKYMISLSEALLTASIIATALGLLLYFLAMLNLILDFRAQVIQARRGIWQFNEPKVAIKTAITFIGTQISNGLFVFLVNAFIFGILFTFLCWQLTWDVLAYVLTTNAALIIAIIGFALLNPIIKFIASKVIMEKKSIKMRYAWAAFELWELMAQVAAGLVKSIVRFALVTLIVFFSLPRLDRSPFPAWFEYYLLLDTGSKSYQGVILTYHLHNNPVMRVACWILQEDSRDRRDPVKRAELGMVTPKKRLAFNRWQKTLFLLRNPSLVAYVKANEAQQQRAVVANLIKKLARRGKSFMEVEEEIKKLEEKEAEKEKRKQEAEERKRRKSSKGFAEESQMRVVEMSEVDVELASQTAKAD